MRTIKVYALGVKIKGKIYIDCDLIFDNRRQANVALVPLLSHKYEIVECELTYKNL